VAGLFAAGLSKTDSGRYSLLPDALGGGAEALTLPPTPPTELPPPPPTTVFTKTTSVVGGLAFLKRLSNSQSLSLGTRTTHPHWFNAEWNSASDNLKAALFFKTATNRTTPKRPRKAKHRVVVQLLHNANHALLLVSGTFDRRKCIGKIEAWTQCRRNPFFSFGIMSQVGWLSHAELVRI
jgi:hypothetical protein